jgi:hypothetical protein
MRAYWGSRGIATSILWPRHQMEVSGQLHAPAASPPWEQPLVPIGQDAGWGPEKFWTRWRRKIPSPRRQSKPRTRSSSPQPSAIPTELSRLYLPNVANIIYLFLEAVLYAGNLPVPYDAISGATYRRRGVTRNKRNSKFRPSRTVNSEQLLVW